MSTPPPWMEAGWRSQAVPRLVADLAGTHGHMNAYSKELEFGHLSVFVGQEEMPDRHPSGKELSWHLSMSHRSNLYPHPPGRLPTWDELKEAREFFLPDDTNFGIFFPPKELYVNVHETTMHLWEAPLWLVQ